MQVYIRLDQPMAALEVYRTGLDKFPNEVTFLTGVARIYEAIGNLSLSAKYYKILLVVRVPGPADKRLTGKGEKMTYSPAAGCNWLCLAGV